MRKIYFITILLSFFAFSVQATTYYSKATGNANQTSSWGTESDGSGTAPSNFTTSGDIFILRSVSTLGLSNTWTIGASVTLQIDGNLNVTSNNDDIIINGTIVFTSPNTTQISLAGGGNGNNFTLNTGATFKTANQNGVQGTGCSLPTASTNGTITLSSGANYEFNGTSNQATTGLPANLSNLIINNTTGVTLSSGITITGLLTLTNGVVSSSASNLLSISSTGSVSGASDASFVNGPVAKTGSTSFDFPVGTTIGGNRYHPISIGAPSVSTTFEAEYIRASSVLLEPDLITGVYAVSACEYWRLDRTGASATADVTLYWNEYSPCGGAYITTLTGLIVAWRDLADSRWENSLGGPQTITSVSPYTTGTLLRTTVDANGFGYFTFGSANINGSPLPVKLSNIRAFEKQQGIQIDWTAYQEDNLNRYQVERSADGQSFMPIGEVAARNLVIESNYSFFDANPLPGVNFYRLKNIDMDGKSGYSNVVKVNLDKNIKGFTLYPNPVRNAVVSFQSSDLSKGNYSVNIFNANGQQVYAQRFNHSGGSVNQTIQLPAGVRSGMYTMQLNNGTMKVMSKTFMVQ